LPALAKLDNLVVVLVRPRNPLNIGAAARAMSNFGVHRLRLVNPYAVAFREARSAVGASALLENAEEFSTVAEAVSDCSVVVGTTAGRNRALQHPVQLLNARTASTIRKRTSKSKVALLFGSEKFGLTNDDFSHCHWLLTIPTHSDHISMNLGQAVAVCLYELDRTAPAKTPVQKIELATAGAAEQITTGLLEALRISGYIKPGTESMFEKKTRRLIRKLKLEAYDAKLFLGMVRQIVWKLQHPTRD
jgi:TrmH family RNA methyltransferase